MFLYFKFIEVFFLNLALSLFYAVLSMDFLTETRHTEELEKIFVKAQGFVLLQFFKSILWSFKNSTIVHTALELRAVEIP